MCSTQGGPLHECLFVYCLYLNHKRARETCSEHATDSSTFPTQTHFISSRKVIKIPGTDVDNHALMGAACFRLYLRYVFPVITDAMSAEVRERDKERESVVESVTASLSLSLSLALHITLNLTNLEQCAVLSSRCWRWEKERAATVTRATLQNTDSFISRQQAKTARW